MASMTRTAALDELLRELAAQHSVVAAMLATGSGEVVAVHPAHGTVPEIMETLRWGVQQVESMAGLRRQMPPEEFSMLLDPPDVGKATHLHVMPVRDHVLVLLFTHRDSFGSIREAAQRALHPLAALLTPES